jgi:hypothetical protein
MTSGFAFIGCGEQNRDGGIAFTFARRLLSLVLGRACSRLIDGR